MLTLSLGVDNTLLTIFKSFFSILAIVVAEGRVFIISEAMFGPDNTTANLPVSSSITSLILLFVLFSIPLAVLTKIHLSETISFN